MPPPGASQVVAEAMARELAYRAEAGVTVEERAEMLEWWDVADEDGTDDVAELDHDAERLLCGLPILSPAEARARAAALDPAEVAALVRQALAGALLLVPRGVDPDTDLPDGESCTTSRTMTTTPLRRRLRSSAPKGSALGFDGDVVEFRDGDGDVHTIRMDDIVGVGVAGSGRELFGRRGCFITVDRRDFAGADAIVRAVDERVPQGYRFDLAEWWGAS